MTANAAILDPAVSLATDAAANRRSHVRLPPSELAWIREVRLKYGPRVSLIDLSAGGALLQTDVRLRPGTDMVIEIIGSEVEAVPFRVVRSELAVLSGKRVVYQGACEFKRTLDLEKAALGAKRTERSDVALKKLLLQRREQLKLGPAAGALSDRALPDLLRAFQEGTGADPLSRGLRDLLSDLIPGLDRGEPGALLRTRLETRLRRSIPRAGVTIAAAPLKPGAGKELIYFKAQGRDEAGVLNIELPHGVTIPDWEFQLLQAGSYLLELLPAEEGLAAASIVAPPTPAV